MNVFLNNNVISDLQFNDYEIATYVALRSIYSSARDTQFVSYNMITKVCGKPTPLGVDRLKGHKNLSSIAI